ncbi:iron uptake porin [Prochlorococcus marinus]|uniref:iron uptake porin n=1 Tax=Prochlorococcus marinus TaxID=1219 RepID=UPI0001900514|nr:iron uptake porin [Prochlorococcus marinus]EEE40168.1 carbohydrate-selective porin, OprB family [Prochlorococcus marinus str. MIT 9202]
MKLFQKMLVAGSALSLIAPVASQASETINLEEMNGFVRSEKASSRLDSKTFINDVSEEIATLKGRVDGLEAKQNNFEAGSFSDTTSLTGKAIFTVGGVENSSGDLTEGVKAQYTYQMNLNTSFTGDDDLYVRLKTGNGGVAPFNNKLMGTYLSSTNTYGDELKVDKIWYSFPVGDKVTAWIGPKIENYYMHGATPSIYKPVLKGFKLGGNGAAYGASTDSGLGVSYNADNGFSISSNLVSDQNGTGSGFLTNQVDENWSTQIAYTKPNWHASLMVALKYDGWADQYYSTSKGATRGTGVNSTNYGLRGYWRPDDAGTATPEVSVGYDISTIDGAASSVDETDAYFVGLTWKDLFQADDKIGVAFGQPQTREDETVDPFMWEAYYSFKVNDGLTVTPAIFGGKDVNGTAGTDVTGAVIETTFKF